MTERFQRLILYLIEIKLGHKTGIGAAWPQCRIIGRTRRRSPATLSQTQPSPQELTRRIAVLGQSSRPNPQPARIMLG